MSITGVVHIDLGRLADEYGHLNTLSVEARRAWQQVDLCEQPATHVRIDVGSLWMSFLWPSDFIERLAEAEHVQIVGTHPDQVRTAVEQITAAVARVRERAA